jgi:hypothetical protein
MRARVGVLLGFVLLLWTATAAATTYLRYRDTRSGCDVFTDRADQIPRNGRDGARVVTEDEALRDQAASLACLRSSELRLRAGGDPTANAPGAASIDARLASNHGRYLTDSEVAALKQLCSFRICVYILAGLAALVAWIALMVTAVRQDHLGWAVLMLFLSAPVAFAYFLLGLGKDRGRFKAACALGILSPFLVLAASACHLLPMATR